MERYEKESFRRSMRLKLDFNNMMTRMVGENGVSEEDLLSLFMQISDAEEAMKEKRAAAGILSQPMKLCEKIEPETLQDHQEFIAGAAYMEDQCQEEDTFRNIGYMFAIMKYIGAKDSFVRAPFILEGMIIGIVGAVIPLIFLYFAYEKTVTFIMTRFSILNSILDFLPVAEVYKTLLPVGLLLGVGIGFVGSFFTIKKHLKA